MWLLDLLGNVVLGMVVAAGAFVLLEVVGLVDDDLRIPWPRRFQRFLWAVADLTFQIGLTLLGLLITLGCWLRARFRK